MTRFRHFSCLIIYKKKFPGIKSILTLEYNTMAATRFNNTLVTSVKLTPQSPQKEFTID